MTTGTDQRELERVRYWQGQMLRSGDLRQQLATGAQLRWWHNRALHHVHGIAFGLTVSADDDESGTFVGVRIAPGVAYDCFGRELVVAVARTLPLPPSPPVSASSSASSSRSTSASSAASSTASSAATTIALLVTYGDAAEFRWMPLGSFGPRDGVALAQVEYVNGLPGLQATFTPDRSRPLAKPHLATGSTIPGGTVFTGVPAPRRRGGTHVQMAVVQTIVDTSGAGFERVPCYFASLQGFDPVRLPVTAFGTLKAIFTSVLDPAPDRFTFRIALVFGPKEEVLADVPSRQDFESPERFAARVLARTESLFSPYVCWLGCEDPQPVDPSLCAWREKTVPCCCS